MQPLLMSANFDPFQVAIVVIFVIASFIKWLWENRARNSTDASTLPTPDATEKRLRDEAWQRQTGRRQPPPLPPPAASPLSPWEELRKAWEEAKEAARQASSQPQAKSRAAPPPRRADARIPQVAAAVQIAPQTSAAGEVAATSPKQGAPAPSSSVMVAGFKPSESRHAHRDFRLNATLLRQAVVWKEILGPPKALQNPADPAI